MKYVLLLFLILLFLRLIFFYFVSPPIPIGQMVSFSAILLEDPKIMGDVQEFHLMYGDFWHSTQVLIETKVDQDYSYGQEVSLVGTLIKKLLKNEKTALIIQNPQIKAKNTQILPFFGAIRAKIVDFCENNFSQPYSGLLVGVIFGDKSLATHPITTSFRITGLSHLLVVDGLKITLVIGFLITLLQSLLPRKRALALATGILILYVGLSGFEISAVRAGLMALIACSAQLFGRQYSGFWALLLVAGIMLLIDPLLLSQIAFQLSVGATIGIMFFAPVLPLRESFLEDLNLTLAAQLPTLPILLGVFGNYSLISLPIHLLVMWTIPFIMTIGGLGMSIGILIPFLGRILTSLIIPLLWYLQQMAQFFSNYPGQVQMQSMPIAFYVGYYMILFCVYILLKGRKKSI